MEYKKRNQRQMANDPRRAELMARPMADLIAAPNCGLRCPEGREFSCGCETCGENNGFYHALDHDRLSEKQFETIESMRTNNGWLGKAGCVLPRELRSDGCLRAVCLHFEAYEV